MVDLAARAAPAPALSSALRAEHSHGGSARTPSRRPEPITADTITADSRHPLDDAVGYPLDQCRPRALPMSTYHLQARLLTGPLHPPTRNELRTAESDNWDELSTIADQLVADGFTVWLFDHGTRTTISGASDYRLITHLRPKPSAPQVKVPATSPHSTPRR